MSDSNAGSNSGSGDWLSPLAEGANAAHEMFAAYMAAGFKREEALRIVIELLKAATGPAGQG